MVYIRSKKNGAAMATSKKAVTFYATPEVAEWLDRLDSGERSRRINDLIKDTMLQPKPKALFEVPLNFYQMADLLEILKETAAKREADYDEADFDRHDPEGMASADEYRDKPGRLLSHFEKFVHSAG
jgi:hypothetical protein